jgi:hypothetical protein
VSIVSPYRYWLKLIEVIAATIILSDFEWDLLSGKWGLSLHIFHVENATQDSDDIQQKHLTATAFLRFHIKSRGCIYP